MFDSHVHTKFSSDSKMIIEDVIKKSQELNLGIVLTEHMDLKYPTEGYFVFKPEEYFKEYSKYKNSKLLLGIEIGIREDTIDDNRKIANNFPFDYVLGSIHIANGVDIYTEEYYKGKSKKEAYEEYLQCMHKCIKTHEFIDSLGHIDYISRYARYEDKEIYYEEFSDYIDEVLKELILREKAIEINTRRIESKEASINLIKIYKRYAELGGKYVTIGSDAHNANDIGKNFKVAQEMCERCNVKSVYFKERKMEYANIRG